MRPRQNAVSESSLCVVTCLFSHFLRAGETLQSPGSVCLQSSVVPGHPSLCNIRDLVRQIDLRFPGLREHAFQLCTRMGPLLSRMNLQPPGHPRELLAGTRWRTSCHPLLLRKTLLQPQEPLAGHRHTGASLLYIGGLWTTMIPQTSNKQQRKYSETETFTDVSGEFGDYFGRVIRFNSRSAIMYIFFDKGSIKTGFLN